MTNNELIDLKSKAAIISHIDMLQGIISRMAKCSMACKKWCLAVVSISLGVFSKDFDWWMFAFELIVCLSFMFLDAAYLAMERNFVRMQKLFIDKINNEQTNSKEIFCIDTKLVKVDIFKILSAAIRLYTSTIYILIIIFLIVYKLNN